MMPQKPAKEERRSEGRSHLVQNSNQNWLNEVALVVIAGFTSDVPGLYLLPFTREVAIHSMKLSIARQPRLTRSSLITWTLVSSNRCAALVNLYSVHLFYTLDRYQCDT